MNLFQHIQNFIQQHSGCIASAFTADKESKAYDGMDFQLGMLKIKYRQAKITPRKTGQFVALWQRNKQGATEPFNANDNIDFYLVAVATATQSGFFFFSKEVLITNHILSSKSKKGKRGFRVYPDWDGAENPQAKKTQGWQSTCFIDMTSNETAAVGKFTAIMNGKQNKLY